MRGTEKIFAINPGSTSTKIALFEGEKLLFKSNVVHDAETMSRYSDLEAQLPYRRDTILKAVAEVGCALEGCAAFSGRGGGLESCESGVYEVNEKMLEDARSGKYGGDHPAALGSQLAHEFAREYGGRAFVVNPPSVDEFQDLARITGIAGVYRGCNTHALNQKETAYRVCQNRGWDYQQVNLIVAHLGGGISVTAHRQGVMVDSNDNISGEGPMAPTRIGTLKIKTVMDLLAAGKVNMEEFKALRTSKGGFVSHLGTADMLEVEARVAAGDTYAKLVRDAFCYQIAKEMGAMAAVLKGKVDLIILTGGISHDREVVNQLKEYAGFIAPFAVQAGEYEMEALSNGVLRVLRGQELVKFYTGVLLFSGFSR